MRLLARLLDWRRELLLAATAAMEACWLYAWIALVLTWLAGPTYAISIFSVFVLLWLGSALVRILDRLEVSLLRQKLYAVGIGLLAILLVIRFELYGGALLSLRWLGRLAAEVVSEWLAIPPPLWLFFAGLFVWWRGLHLGQEIPGSGMVALRFRLGIVALMIYLILAAFGDGTAYTPLLLGFFFFGLLAIALARVNELSQGRDGMRAPFGSSWLGILAGSAAVVVSLGLLASRLLSLDHVQAAARSLRPITEPLGQLLRGIALILLFLVVTLGSLLSRLLRALLGEAAPVEEVPLPEFSEMDQLEGFDLTRFLGWAKIGRDVLLIAVVLGAILAVFLAVRRRWTQRDQGRDVIRESIWSTGGFMDDLAAMLRGGWRRLREGAAQGLAMLRGERYSLLSIRHIYASLNRLAAEHGYPREEVATPREYIRTLAQAWPEQIAEIQLLTEAYVQAHYGERADTAEALQRAWEAWERIRMTQPAAKSAESEADAAG